MKALLTTVILALTILSCSYGDVPDEKTTAVKELFSIIGMDKQMTGGFEAMLPIVDQLATQLQLNPEEKEELRNIYRDWFEKDIDRQSIISKATQLYAEAFTLQEIRTLVDFYKSPTGKKFLERAPELMKAGAQIGMEEAQKKQSRLMERLKPFLEKHQQ